MAAHGVMLPNGRDSKQVFLSDQDHDGALDDEDDKSSVRSFGSKKSDRSLSSKKTSASRATTVESFTSLSTEAEGFVCCTVVLQYALFRPSYSLTT